MEHELFILKSKAGHWMWHYHRDGELHTCGAGYEDQFEAIETPRSSLPTLTGRFKSCFRWTPRWSDSWWAGSLCRPERRIAPPVNLAQDRPGTRARAQLGITNN